MRGRFEQGRREYLTLQEQTAITAASRTGRNGKRDQAICLLFLAHGFRVSELADLRLTDLDMNGPQWASVYVRRLKGSISRSHPLGDKTKRALRKWLAIRPDDTGFDHVFLSEQGLPMHRNTLHVLVKSWGERALIAFPVGPHMLRHSCGFRIANTPGASTRFLQEWLGHANPSHTTRYTRLSTEEFRRLSWGI